MYDSFVEYLLDESAQPENVQMVNTVDQQTTTYLPTEERMVDPQPMVALNEVNSISS